MQFAIFIWEDDLLKMQLLRVKLHALPELPINKKDSKLLCLLQILFSLNIVI